jgi:proline iminopeptidase
VLIELPDGARVHTRVEGAGPPVVLAHGGPGLWDHLDGLADLLRPSFRLHRWDQRGCGASEPVPAYGLDVAVDDVQALKAAWQVEEPWAVIGHSWGAHLALRAALLHPGSTRAVVYLSGTGSQAWWDAEGRAAYKAAQAARLGAERRARLDALDAMSQRTADQERDYRALSWVTDLAVPDESEPELQRMASAPHAIRFDINRSLIPSLEDDAALLERLPTCDVPFLVLHGSEDIRPWHGAQELAERLPNGTFHLIDGAGHLPWVERPDELREQIVSFLA